MAAIDDTVPPVEAGLGNGPGKPFAVRRNKNGDLDYAMFHGHRLTWRDGDHSQSDLAADTLSSRALMAMEGFVFQASALRMAGFKVFRTGDYHIRTWMGYTGEVVKFLTTEYRPAGQEWVGPRDIAHLAFLSLEKWELPVYHFWVDPTIFKKEADQMTQAERIDEAIDKSRADKAAQQAPAVVKIRPEPNITSGDQLWKDKLAHFQELLASYEKNNRQRSLMDLIHETFIACQITSLVASGERSRLSILQSRDRMLYFDSLDVGPFKGVNNNAATKFCMVYFGLPIEPLTLINIINAAKFEDDPREQVKLDYSAMSRIYGGEANLEFLDKYSERSHGYPYLRITKSKRPYKAIPEDVSNLLREQSRIEDELYPAPKIMCGGNFDFHMGGYGSDSYPTYSEVSEDNFRDVDTVGTLRGGAEPSEVAGDIDYDDDDDADCRSSDEPFSDVEDVIANDLSMPELPRERTGEEDVDNFRDMADVNASHYLSGMYRSDVRLRGGALPPAESEDGVHPSSKTSSLRKSFMNTNDWKRDAAAMVPDVPRPTASYFKFSKRPSSDPNHYKEYMIEAAKSRVQDDLRVEAYRKEQSVHEPNPEQPEPTRYGKAIESQIVAGDTSPSLSSNGLSLDEVRALQKRNRDLENVILGRMVYCGICNQYISFTTVEQRDAHFAGHVDGLLTCGFCAIGFGSWTRKQRQDHLATHADTRYIRQIPNPPQPATSTNASIKASNTTLRGREAGLSSVTPNPGSNVKIYCQNCSVDMINFTTPAQLIEHTETCPKKHRQPSQPVCCKFCAVDVISLGGAREILSHQEICNGLTDEQEGRQQALWRVATSESADKDRSEATYWILCALTGIPELYYDPSAPSPGLFECRYSECNADLVKLAHNGTLKDHHKMHIYRKDRFKYPCQSELCSKDLSKLDRMGPERIQRHMSRHFENQCAFPRCQFKFRDENLYPSTLEIEHEAQRDWADHVLTHLHIPLREEEYDDDGSDSFISISTDNHNDGEMDDDRPNINTGSGHPPRRESLSRPKELPNPGKGNPSTTQRKQSRPPKPGKPPGTVVQSDRPQPLQPPESGLHYGTLPKEWSNSLELIPQQRSPGGKRRKPWRFICPVCFSAPQSAMLAWHRTTCPDGSEGCGVNDDDDLIIFHSSGARRIRNSNDKYDYEKMLAQGAATWGDIRQRPDVSDYLIENPPTESQISINAPITYNPSSKLKFAVEKLKDQQATTKQTLLDKAARKAGTVPKRNRRGKAKTKTKTTEKEKEKGKRSAPDPVADKRPRKKIRTSQSLPAKRTPAEEETLEGETLVDEENLADEETLVGKEGRVFSPPNRIKPSKIINQLRLSSYQSDEEEPVVNSAPNPPSARKITYAKKRIPPISSDSESSE